MEILKEDLEKMRFLSRVIDPFRPTSITITSSFHALKQKPTASLQTHYKVS